MANQGEDGQSTFSVEVGQRLRAVRRLRKLSLDDVERESGGQWSASAIGAYERGFRNLSLPRLRELAEFYHGKSGSTSPITEWAATLSADNAPKGLGHLFADQPAPVAPVVPVVPGAPRLPDANAGVE